MVHGILKFSHIPYVVSIISPISGFTTATMWITTQMKHTHFANALDKHVYHNNKMDNEGCNTIYLHKIKLQHAWSNAYKILKHT